MISTYTEAHLLLYFTCIAKYFLYLFSIWLVFYYSPKPVFCRLKKFTVFCFSLIAYEILIPMDPVVCISLWMSQCFSTLLSLSLYSSILCVWQKQTISTFLIYIFIGVVLQFYSHLLNTHQILITEVPIEYTGINKNNKFKVVC